LFQPENNYGLTISQNVLFIADEVIEKGSTAEVTPSHYDVCYTPGSRQCSDAFARRLRAKQRHRRRSK
jgi:hypothetical protein